MKLIINVCAEDGELLEQIEWEVNDDLTRPLGTQENQEALLDALGDVARIVITRKRNGERQNGVAAFTKVPPPAAEPS